LDWNKNQAGAPADDVEEGWIQQLEFFKEEVGKMLGFLLNLLLLFFFCFFLIS